MNVWPKHSLKQASMRNSSPLSTELKLRYLSSYANSHTSCIIFVCIIKFSHTDVCCCNDDACISATLRCWPVCHALLCFLPIQYLCDNAADLLPWVRQCSGGVTVHQSPQITSNNVLTRLLHCKQWERSPLLVVICFDHHHPVHSHGQLWLFRPCLLPGKLQEPVYASRCYLRAAWTSKSLTP